jgi:hypothetical protein
MTEDEKAAIRDALMLLENATCNSLDPADRINWRVAQRRVVRDLQEMAR